MNRLLPLLAFLPALLLAAPDGNRLTYLYEKDPYYPHAGMARLTTPQWIGEPEVEAVVILSIDDLRDPQKWENYLRPILERLKQIDGRAPFSIMCCELKPEEPLFQRWLGEGLSLEVHTLAHPCPLLGKTDFAGAEKTVLEGLDRLADIPGNRPRVFRMPCCDSMNSASPRFYAEIFPERSPGGHFFSADSSVMNLFTSADPALPKELVQEPGGAERFRKYFPQELAPPRRLTFERFGGYIENYSYPYLIGAAGWEFPCAVPSDWEAFNNQGAANPLTTGDWKAALDATVLKQGIMPMVLHPHGWSKPEQIIELIDYATAKYGSRVKFLTFREALERLEKNALGGQPVRTAEGVPNGVRLIDVDGDGFMDVVIGNHERRLTRRWDPKTHQWDEVSTPVRLIPSEAPVAGLAPADSFHFGITSPDGAATLLAKGDRAGAWRFQNGIWQPVPALLRGLESVPFGPGVQLRDFDGDGVCELLLSTPSRNEIYTWSQTEGRWSRAEYALPPGVSLTDAAGRDAGLRFADLNADGADDLLFSTPDRFSVRLWAKTVRPNLGWAKGWSVLVREGARTGAPAEPPPFVRAGAHPNNGVWFRGDALFVQNEDTAKLPAVTDRRSFKELIAYEIPPPKSPEEALASMRPRPGFSVELVASEPLIEDPIAMEWDERGRLWVLEMRDYPLGMDGQGKPGGTIKILEDTDHDGRYDKATTFLDGIPFPTGVLPWGKGALVAAAPDLFYAEDADGDGRADKRVVLYTGFTEGNQQHRFNGFEYGLDGWIYCANGDSGGKVHPVGTPSPELELRGHDFRLKPETGEIELVEGQTQFGRHMDDWGNWFGCSNSRWLWHYFLPERYLAGNPRLPVKTLQHDVPNYPDFTRVYPATAGAIRFNQPQSLGHVTSACSALPYRDDLFGPDFATSVFISEPVHNCVHREVLEPDGVTFSSQRAADEQSSEFLASTDEWFRPTGLKTGPDGALYVADMYRFVIEHPQWIAPETQARLNLRAGENKGRIYRIAPTGAPRRPIPDLSKLNQTELARAMDSPSAWQRTMVQRLLRQHGNGVNGGGAEEILQHLATEAKDPKVRLQALAGLTGEGLLWQAAVHDPHPAIRRFAIRDLESAFGNGPNDLQAVAPLVDDPDASVRYQLALSLGKFPSRTPAGELLGKLALHDGADPYFRTALLIGAALHAEKMQAALAATPLSQRPFGLQAELIASLGGDSRKALAAIARYLQDVAPAEIPNADVQGQRLRFSAASALLQSLAKHGGAPELMAPAAAGLSALQAEVKAAVDSPQGDLAAAAVSLLGWLPEAKDRDLPVLSRQLTARRPPAVQSAALAVLARLKTPKAASVLASAIPVLGPAQREEALTALLARPAGIEALLSSLEQQRLRAADLPTTVQQSLLHLPQEPQRQRAAQLLKPSAEDRQALVDRYLAALPASGSAQRGREIFRANCTLCHRLKGDGVEVGPDLAMMAGKPADQIVTAILDPNQAIEQRYLAFAATSQDGRAFAGIISSDTGTALTLRAPTGLEQTFLRAELKELTPTNRSLMPEGFEQALSPTQVADLVSYLREP